ncbi:hypothetical protein PtA15_12A121 [Puccinia triticina]|uniref:Uncharacterized protein n=1 Tax=Puccinia triticina TaxID=208348 RepID=A0ABY7CZS3_9BASI|nr:uncharacterized protein PtA15_12A121 [Puccinia triticina]WAQ90135.1 hypothetical protein PtA15_12A121 [Puccinia triticina]WAR61421.1 hypothetical protein PtB15_12B106 [Puccinia triticina]
MAHPSVQQPALLPKTPAISRTARKAQQSRTVGPKAHKPFEIYIDPNQPSATDAHPRSFKPSISATPANRNKTLAAGPSTRKHAGKPLEDKTNTLRKKKPVGHLLPSAGRLDAKQSGSPTLTTAKPKATPHHHHEATKTAAGRTSPPTTKLRLLYRTPATAKRAPRPPQPLFSSGAEDNDDEEYEQSLDDQQLSPVLSAFQTNFTLENVPDVEFGPPSATIEQVELPSPDDRVDFGAFLGGLQDHLGSAAGPAVAGGNALDAEVARVVAEDGRKELWTREPECRMPLFEDVQGLEGLHLPPPPTARPASKARLGRPASSTRLLRPAVARTTLPPSRPPSAPRPPTLPARATRTHAPPSSTHPASSKPTVSKPVVSKPAVSKPAVSKPAVARPPMVARFHAILDTLVRQEQALVLADLAQDKLLLASGAEWDAGLDDVVLDL